MKKNKDNLKYISDKFAEENISVPDSLSEENISGLLDNDNRVININTPKARTFKGAKALVASLAVVVTALAVFGITKGAIKLKNEAQFNKNTSNGIVSFTSFDQIKQYNKKFKDNNFFTDKYVVYESDMAVRKNDTAADGYNSSQSAKSFAETYKQVEGVDEADIVKTDANYIYWLVDSEGKIVISSAHGLNTKKVSEIHLKDGVFASEMFLKGDTLVLTGTNYYSEDGSFILVYDISDRSKPELKSSYSQSGNYTDARMIGECVYLVSSNNAFVFPYCTTDAVRKQVDYSDICAVKDSEYASYTLIGAFDTATGKSKSAKAVIGTSAQIYCSENNLYLFSTIDDSLKVLRYELKGAKIALRASGSVKGRINDQFSADEKNGFLRLATTYYGNSAEVNKLYVLDEGLKVVGSVSGFAKNEHIEAVKYIGDYAYVITYKTTDPLFIIDLTNPRAPQITGKVKIEGFSTLLYPVDDNTLLGIGYNTELVEESFVEAERTDGVKLVLFDISDKNNPKISDQKIYEGASSSAQENHKALVINKEKGYFAIPLENNFGDSDEGEILVFGEKDGKFDIKNEFSTPATIERCTYIGDYIYGIDTYCENIYSFK